MVLNVQDFAYDIGIFAGLGLGMYAMNQLLGQRLSDTNVLEGHPSIQRSPFVRPVLQVHELQQPALFAELLGMLDRFLTVIDLDLVNYGFEANRLAVAIPQKVRQICRLASHSSDARVASLAIDIEGDDVQAFETICDQSVRNMMLNDRR